MKSYGEIGCGPFQAYRVMGPWPLLLAKASFWDDYAAGWNATLTLMKVTATEQNTVPLCKYLYGTVRWVYMLIQIPYRPALSRVCTPYLYLSWQRLLCRGRAQIHPLFPLLQGGSIDVFMYHMHHAGSHYGPGALPPPLTTINSTLLSD